MISPVNLQYVLVLLGGLLALSSGSFPEPEGYRAIVRYEDGFVAAGTGGRIDRISETGEVLKSEVFPGVRFNCMTSDDDIIIAAGDNGKILIAEGDGIFRIVESATTNNINSLALFNKTIIAGCDKGEILSRVEGGFFIRTHLEVKGNIVSVSAGRNSCFGVTDESEIIHSTDGISWDILDFNKVYAGFYSPCHFTRILVTEEQVALAGVTNDGSPVLMFSSGGKVWTERKLDYTDERGTPGFMQETPHDMYYDQAEAQVFLVFGKGKVMKLSSCSHCNDVAVITEEELTGISGNDDTLMIVGSNFFIKALNIR